MRSRIRLLIGRLELPAVAAVLVAGTLALEGCAVSGVDLVQDRRVEIQEPAEQASVSPPLTVRWSAHDTAGLHFAVFVDRPPIPPGASLRSLAKQDHACLARPDCPDQAWLAGKGVYVADSTAVRVAALGDNRPEHQPRARDAHEVTIVLLDGDRRSGESAWHRQFYVPR